MLNLNDKRLTYTLLATIGILLAILLGMALSGDRAVAQLPGGDDRYMVAVNSFWRDNRDPVLIVDTRKQVMAVYTFDAEQPLLFFAAVRSYEWDRKLLEFNCASPSVRDVLSGKAGRRP